jgi:hypothetical protein
VRLDLVQVPAADKPSLGKRGGTTSRFLILVQVCAWACTAEFRAPAAPLHRGQKESRMSTTEHDNEPVPWMQQLLDNPFLLLFLGVLVPMLVYTLWGVIDILTVPLAK